MSATHAAFAIRATSTQNRTMSVDRSDRCVDRGQQSLGFADSVAQEQAGCPTLLIGSPPLVDLIKHIRRSVPAIQRQAKSRFSYKGVAPHRFKTCTRWIGLQFYSRPKQRILRQRLRCELVRTQSYDRLGAATLEHRQWYARHHSRQNELAPNVQAAFAGWLTQPGPPCSFRNHSAHGRCAHA